MRSLSTKQHFGYIDSTSFHPTAEYAKLSAYFNLDNGSGKIRGVYDQGNAAVAPIFDAWLGPFKSMSMEIETIANTGSTDHIAFDNLGLPGFQFVQDPLDYSTRTHHTNQDVYERLQPDDMMFNAAVLAAFAWQAAQRDQPLPRKPAPFSTPGGPRTRGQFCRCSGAGAKMEMAYRKRWDEEIAEMRRVLSGLAMQEERKWGKPTYTVGGKNIVIMQGMKEYFALGFFQGALLKDSRKVLVQLGQVQAGRVMKFASAKEITANAATIKAYVREAIAVEKAGLRMACRRRPQTIRCPRS